MSVRGAGRSPGGVALRVAGVLAILACSDGGERTLAQQGEQIYSSNCIACHHRDPGRDGPIGPAVAGASRELIEARLLRAEYPPGYEPKRETQQMPAQPYLAPHVPALAAYLEPLGNGGE